MPIRFDEKTKVFHLDTRNSSYQIMVGKSNVLLHLYYGRPTNCAMDYLLQKVDRGFSGNPYEEQDNRWFSLDTLPQEYSSSGVGDYRTPAIRILGENGSRSVDLRYVEHSIFEGRNALAGLPHVREDDDCETLLITLEDRVWNLRVQLQYQVFASKDCIGRSTYIENLGEQSISLEKVASSHMDFLYGDFDYIHFHGRHCMERLAEREAVNHGLRSFGSERGGSSHHENPFLILCDSKATEQQGDCYGFLFMYSGNHLFEVEKNQANSTRVVAGIHPAGFSWKLAKGESFQSPEMLLAYSGEGLNALSHTFHTAIKDLVIPAEFRGKKKPVLVNSWEASYFDFTAKDILRLGQTAAELGVGMLVLDDGWFGKRNDDTTGLGDWLANEGKLGCSLAELSEKIHAMGLQFGLWFEPEMISEDSELYRKHPDWALCDPNRKPTLSRKQMVLDMARPEVVDYLFTSMSQILDDVQIEYIKWDFNRSLANVYSHALPPERQGELYHRFVLGTYELLQRLRERYPSLVIEGCSGGGGRFDAGMLFYCPQIWTSDNTDAIDRLAIQRGTSYAYPIASMGTHVSVSPNHQSGRSCPIDTRGIVAMAGTFGYELDLSLLSAAEKMQVQEQIKQYHKLEKLINEGRYYRLTELEDKGLFEAWMMVSADKTEALLSLVVKEVQGNSLCPYVKLQGLCPEKQYRLQGSEKVYSGAALLYGGYSFPQMTGDYPAVQLHFSAV